MKPTLSYTESEMFVVLRRILMAWLPADVSVVKSQINRVPEPPGTDFVLMTPIMRTRLETNTDRYQDVSFTGSIAGTILTASGTTGGTIITGATLFSESVVDDTIILGYVTGSGGDGTYSVSVPQSVGPVTMYAGLKSVLQPTKVDIQLDVHGPNSADNTQIISTLFRDGYATRAFATDPAGLDLQALYADEPKQLPFVNGESQFEDRWVMTLCLQANQLVYVSQQFFDEVDVGLVEVV